jgi:alpha-tubulin suppressor-like RCC1 family protein
LNRRYLVLALVLTACSAPRSQPRQTNTGSGTGGEGDTGGGAGTGGVGAGGSTGFDGGTVGTGGQVGADSGVPGDSAVPGAEAGTMPDMGSSDAPAGTDALSDAPLSADAPAPTDGPPAKLPNGSSCSGGSACVSTFCVDGVCCESACQGQCEACGQPNNFGTCVAVAGPSVGNRPACAGQGSCGASCNGVNRQGCSYPASEKECATANCIAGTAYSSSVCDGKGGCLPQTTVACGAGGCVGTICAGGCSASNPCPTDQFCNAGKCFPKQALGGACTIAGACQSGKCVDGVCCDAACDGACETCSGGGHCAPVKSADDDHCVGGKTCDAAGACKPRAGSDCSSGTDCATGNCVDGKCCISSSCGACQACTGGGGICVAVTSKDDDGCTGTCDASGVCKSKQGQACGAGCESGTFCSPDGYCCDQPCTASCMACNISGNLGKCTPKMPSACADAGPPADAGQAADVSGDTLSCGSGTSTCSPAQVCSVGTCVDVVTVSAGDIHTCALLSDGYARCWGYNVDGEAGNGTSAIRVLTPTAVSGLSGATAIAAGTRHSCALLAGGSVKCWGSNLDGQLGIDLAQKRSLVPVTVGGVAGATALVVGGSHSCALFSGGSVKCWGRNFEGQLGNGTRSGSFMPVAVSGLSGAIHLTAGQLATCAVLTDQSVSCWGVQVGTESAPTYWTIPHGISGLTGVTQASVYNQACVLSVGGSIRCWGDNSLGQVGEPTMMTVSMPTLVMGVSGATQVAAGGARTCALASGGSIKCWGQDYSSSPTPVSGLTEPRSVTNGGQFTCATVAGGLPRCWGQNGFGQLGDGTTTNSPTTPVVVAGW